MDSQLLSDREVMQFAINLGEKGRVSAPPNPWVGCVIAKNGKILGTGYHRQPGEPHAEIHALKEAGNAAESSTVYVTLEPCAHYGRTPPCILSLIEAKVGRVVIGILDPDEKVQGRGAAALKEAGIAVEIGVMRKEVEKSLTPYLHQRRTGMPYCLLKAAISIDGRIADFEGNSKWISSEEARRHTHQLRAESQAILVGAGTAMADQPLLTVRHGILYREAPLRVLFDPQGKTEPNGPLFDQAEAKTIIFTGRQSDQKRIAQWESMGVEVMPVIEQEGPKLTQMLKILGKRGILQLMIEGGSRIFQLFLEEEKIDRIQLYMGTCVLGAAGIPLFSGDKQLMSNTPKFILEGCAQYGQTTGIVFEKQN